MSRDILFKPLLGFFDSLKAEGFPAKLERITGKNGDGDLCKTSDIEWAKKKEAAGVIELVQPDNQYGITKITIVEGMLESDPVTYQLEVDINDEETIEISEVELLRYPKSRTISLSEGEIFLYPKFRQKFLATFQKMLPPLKNAEWEAVITPLIENAERVQEDANETPIVLEIINKIENSEIVKEMKELTTGAGGKVWLDESVNTLYVLSHDIEPIADKYKVTLERLTKLLKYYKKGKTRRQRIGNKRYYLWGFSPSLFEMAGGKK